MNPDTNKFEPLLDAVGDMIDRMSEPKILRPDGTPVPEHWSQFQVGERVVVKNYTFKVAHIGESHLLLEPAGPVLVGESG